MNLINIEDLQNLNHSYHNNKSSLHFIYGASKSGKTTIIKDFIIKKNYLYLTCTPVSKSILIKSFANIISKKFKQNNLPDYFNNFEDILLLLSKQNISNNFTIIFDNFHELIKLDKNALSTLFKAWESTLKNINLQIIILSAIKFDSKFNKKLLKYENNSFYIEDIKFDNIKKLKNISALDKLYIYSFFGASDHFINYYNKNDEFIKNIYKIALQPSSPFFYYGFDFLKQNLSDISTYSSILYAIAKGNNKITQIANFINVKPEHLSRYMTKLQDLFIVHKHLPINDKFKNSKFGRYYINDKFLNFWFSYVFENISFLEMKKHTSVLKQINETFLKKIIEPAYKDYIFSIIHNYPEKYLGYIPSEIGKWWDNTDEIDIVAYNDEEITFISIFWDKSNIASLYYPTLKEISSKYKTNLKRNYIIISENTYINTLKANTNE